MVILFDVLGTLFSLNKVMDRFRDQGIPQEVMELWFEKLMQTAMASALTRKYFPLDVLARSTLLQVFAQKKVHEKQLERILTALQEIEPHGDARGCLRTLRDDGHRLVALSNLSYDETERLMLRSGLYGEFERFYSADMARACMPHPALYELVFRTMFVGPYESCMVAAYGWNVLGAHAVGMSTIYIERAEKLWPFPGSPAGFIVSNLRDIPFAVASRLEHEGLKEAA